MSASHISIIPGLPNKHMSIEWLSASLMLLRCFAMTLGDYSDWSGRHLPGLAITLKTLELRNLPSHPLEVVSC